MWQSGTLGLWLTGKSVGSVKNLRNDSDLKRLCRGTTADDGLCLLSSTVCVIQVFVSLSVEMCQKYVASPSCPWLNTKESPYANWIVPPGVFGNTVRHGVFAVSEPAQGQVFFEIQKKQLTFSCIKMHFTSQFFSFLQTDSKYFMVKTNTIL